MKKILYLIFVALTGLHFIASSQIPTNKKSPTNQITIGIKDSLYSSILGEKRTKI